MFYFCRFRGVHFLILLFLSCVFPLSASFRNSFSFLSRLYENQDYRFLIPKCNDFLQSSVWDQRKREVVLFFLTDSYFQSRQYTLAIETGDLLLKKHPKSLLVPRVHIVLGHSYYSLGYPLNTISHMEIILKDFKKTHWFLYALKLLGDSFYAIQDYKNASGSYELFLKHFFMRGTKKRFLKIQKTLYSVSYYTILSSFQMFQSQEALLKIKRTFQILKNMTQQQKQALMFLKIQILKKMLHFKEALKLIDCVSKDMSKNSFFFKKIFLEKIDIYLKIKRYRELRELLKHSDYYQWNEQEKNFLLQKKAFSFFYEKKYQKAILLWQDMVKNIESPFQKNEIYLYIGLSFYNLFDYQKSLECFKRIEKSFPVCHPRVYYYMAWCYIGLKKEEKGIFFLHKMLNSLQKDPLKADILLWLSDHYALQKNFKKQRKYLLRIMNEYPKTQLFGESCYRQALLDIKGKNDDAALNKIEKIPHDQEIYKEAFLKAMDIYLRKGDYQKVIDQLSMIMKKKSFSSLKQNCFYLIGKASYFSKQWIQSSEYFKKSLYGQDPNIIIESSFFLAKTLFHQNLFTESLNMFIKLENRFLSGEKNDLYFQSRLGMARCFEKLKRWNASQNIYSEMLFSKNRKYAAVAKEFLSILKIKRKKYQL